MTDYKVKPIQLCGLDIETTGVDINKGHRLIQFGMAIKNGAKVVADILPMGTTTIDPEALKVNGFTLERIQAGIPNDEYDAQLSKEMLSLGYDDGDLTPVGFNVGGFDMVFIKRELPLTSRFFSYRTLDLTGVAMIYELTTGQSYRDIKDEFHKKVATVLGRDQRHDALYDAEAALVCIDLFKELLNGK